MRTDHPVMVGMQRIAAMSDDKADKESWVRRRAYQIWQDGGESHGDHDDHWHQAEREYDESMRTPADVTTASDLEQDSIEIPPPSGTSTTEIPEHSGLTTAAPARAEREPPGKA